MRKRTVVLLDEENPENRKTVKDACEENGFKFAEFETLVEAQVEHSGPTRYHLYAAFDDILDRIKTEKS